MLLLRVLRIPSLISLVIFCWTQVVAGPRCAADVVYDIPKMGGVTIDGNAADWKEQGLKVNVLTDAQGNMKPAKNFDARIRLGWDEQGLLVLVRVQDDVAAESDYDRRLFARDSVELFVASHRGSADYYELVIAPGMDRRYPQPRHIFFDKREADKTEPLRAQIARSRFEDGYAIEVRLPWTNLGTNAQAGTELALQVLVSDSDSDQPNDKYTVHWHPDGDTFKNRDSMQVVRLSKEPGNEVNLAMRGGYDQRAGITWVKAIGAEPLANEELQLKWGGANQRNFALKRDSAERFSASLQLPLPSVPNESSQFEILHKGKPLAEYQLPPLGKVQAFALFDQEFLFRPYIFEGENFPTCDFANVEQVERGLGKYSIKTTFYNADFQEVSIAKAPGRYGAVIEVTPANGQPTRRYRTLFRAPDQLLGWSRQRHGVSAVAAILRDDPAVRAQYPRWHPWHRDFAWLYGDAPRIARHGAILAAGVFEEVARGHENGKAMADPWFLERSWWLEFQKRTSAIRATQTVAFQCPQPLAEEPARVLRFGTPGEAGFSDQTVEKLDKLLQRWSVEKSDPLAVCLARHGIVWFHRAYGSINGEGMTCERPVIVLDVSKVLSGVLMAAMIDQGLIKTDDPLEKYFPKLQKIPVKDPVRIEHLYAHTSGLPGFPWGYGKIDIEDSLADYYGYLSVNKEELYTGAGMAVGGAIMERTLGEIVPTLMRRHLLDPLGCEHTLFDNTHNNTYSTPLDLAAIGQLILNKGAFGGVRYFGEKGTHLLLPAGQVEGRTMRFQRGFGTSWLKPDSFEQSPRPADAGRGHVLGCITSNSTLLQIDEQHDSVIAITNYSERRNCLLYQEEFFGILKAGNLDVPHQN